MKFKDLPIGSKFICAPSKGERLNKAFFIFIKVEPILSKDVQIAGFDYTANAIRIKDGIASTMTTGMEIIQVE